MTLEYRQLLGLDQTTKIREILTGTPENQGEWGAVPLQPSKGGEREQKYPSYAA